MVDYATNADTPTKKREFIPSVDRMRMLPIPRLRRKEPAMRLQPVGGTIDTRRAVSAKPDNQGDREHGQGFRFFAASLNGHAPAMVYAGTGRMRPTH